MFPRLRVPKKSERLNDSDRCGTECGKFRKKNRTFAASAAFSLFAAVAIFCTFLGNGTLAQTVGNDSVTNNFDIKIGKYFTITFQYYLWDDHDNCVRFYMDQDVKVEANQVDGDGNAYATYQFPTDFTKDPYLPESDHTYYKFASFWGPDDENATVDTTNGNIDKRQWKRIWNPELEKDNNLDKSTNLSEDSKITVKGDMIYEVNYYPKKYSITYDLGWNEEENPITSVHGSNDLNNPGDYTVIYREEIQPPTRLGYEFLGWSKNDKDAEPEKAPIINPNAELDAGKATKYGENYEENAGNEFYYIPYLDNKYKGTSGEHYIGKLNPNYEKIMELYEELDKERETGDVTFYAQWKLNPYKITYDLKGGSLVDKDGKALPYTYDKTLEKFVDVDNSPVDNVPGAPTTYNVELGDEEGNPLPGVESADGSVEQRKLTIDVMATPPENSNSTFAGWQFYDAEGLSQVSTPIVISHGTVGDFDLEAVFISSESTSNRIIYENVPKEWLEGDNPLPETYSKSGDATVIPVKSTTRKVQTGTDEEGNPMIKTYEFTGWTCSNEYSVAPIRVNNDLTIPTTTQGDIILVAHWQETTEDDYCTVNYYAQKKPHIGFIPEYKVKAGETITLVENQYTLISDEYQNAIFGGWHMYTTVGEHIETFQAGDRVEINKDTAFHAVWKTAVTFQPYLGETPETLELEYGKPLSDYRDELAELETKTKMSGYQLIGWSSSPEDAEKGIIIEDLSQVVVEDDLKLYAAWRKLKHSIVFCDGDNAETMELDVVEETEDGVIVTLPELSTFTTLSQTKDGYLFGGWLDEKNAKVYQPGDSPTVKNGEPSTLQAYWIAKKQAVPVKFTATDGTETNGVINIELDDNGQCTFKLSDLQNITTTDGEQPFKDKHSFQVYVYNKFGSAYSVGLLNADSPEVSFSIDDSYGEARFTDYGASLSITCWW